MGKRFLAEKYRQQKSSSLGEIVDLSQKYADIIDLSLGDPDIITPEEIIDSAFADAKRGHTRYAHSQGDVELREEIANSYKKRYGFDVGIDEVMAVVGANHGLYLALEAVVDQGDEVIIHEPYYTPYELQVRMAGGKPVFLQTFEEDGFQIDVKRLEGLITEKTKAIIINTPSNPTGACFGEEVMLSISKLAIDRDLLIISDDVYGSFTFNTTFKPMATFPGMKERTIIMGSFSKDFAMTGWRIGYIIAPASIIRCIREINEAVCYSAPTISQRAAVKALKVRDRVRSEIVDIFRERVYYSYERISRIPGLSSMEPQGSFYLFVNIKQTGLSSRQVSRILLEDAHVLVIPGTAFGESGEGYIRIACTVSKNRLKEAFNRIKKISLFQIEGSA